VLSSEALQGAEPKWRPLAGRIDQRLRDGANSYSLDYSPAHPMTPFVDRANRIRRMESVRRRGVVLGSEEGVSWSVPLLDFAHGALSVQNAALWRKKKEFGTWWPPDRPRIFFQPVDPGAEFSQAKYDPASRLPLRWDVPMTEFPGLVKRRQLLELLYGVPSIWAMDRRQLRESQPELTKLLEFFYPLHRRIATEPLTGLERLSADRLVQRTTFGNEATLTANFGSRQEPPAQFLAILPCFVSFP
jgi:hypothetical protein